MFNYRAPRFSGGLFQKLQLRIPKEHTRCSPTDRFWLMERLPAYNREFFF